MLLTDYVQRAQEILMNAGIGKAARVLSSEHFIKMQMDSLTAKTGFPVKWFRDRKEAEAWLDEA